MKRFIKKRRRKEKSKTAESAPARAGAEALILNEAVNLEKQSIFIAIPKTGSTSVRSQLRPAGTPLIENPHLNILQIRDSLYVYFLQQTLGQNENFPAKNVPRDSDVRHRARQAFAESFKFSSVRNPWARAVSLYFRREGVKNREVASFEDFCDKHFHASDTCRQPTLHKNQLDWLCDEQGHCLMDYVYKLENFDRAIEEIAALTNGRIRISNKRINANPEALAENYRDFYSERTKQVIARRFEKDIDYFKYSF